MTTTDPKLDPFCLRVPERKREKAMTALLKPVAKHVEVLGVPGYRLSQPGHKIQK